MTFDLPILALFESVSPFTRGIIGTLFIGLVAGGLARLLVPGRDAMGCLMTALLGIGGAFVALFVGKMFNLYQVGDTAGFIGATVGAIILLLIFRMVRPRA